MACADGRISNQEKEMLERQTEQLAMSLEDFDAAMPEGEFELQELTITPPRKTEERAFWLKSLIQIALLDGFMSEEEFLACMHFANQLKVPDDIFQSLLESIIGPAPA